MSEAHAPEPPLAVVVGAGGLGGPAALTLAARGLRVRLIDDDVVELSNLQRQVHFSTADLGRPKVEAARDRILEAVPGASVEVAHARLARDDEALLGGASLLVDATDDPRARFLINAAAVRRGVAAAIGGVQRFNGLAVAVGAGFGPCFACLFEPDDALGVGTCAGLGVLGAVAGVVGHLLGELGAGLVNGRAPALAGRAHVIDALAGRVRTFDLPEQTGCAVCGGVRVVDIRADRCPFTWVKTRLALEAAPPGAVLDVRLRPGEAPRNVARNLKDEGQGLLLDGPIDGETHRLVVRKVA